MKFLAMVVALAGVAHADDKSKVISGALEHALSVSNESELPPIVLLDNETKFHEAFIYGDGSPVDELMHPVVGLAADGHSGWVAADTMAIMVCGMEGCDKIVRDAERQERIKPPYHITALVEDGKAVMLHIGSTGKGVGYGDMDPDVPDDAKPLLAQLEKSLADPKALAAAISPRKDVVLYGTEPTERFVGGAAAKATLLKWGLSFTVHGTGIRAGFTKSKTVAWIAADVDARAAKAKTTTPYRITVIYEKTGADWKIVQIHFT